MLELPQAFLQAIDVTLLMCPFRDCVAISRGFLHSGSEQFQTVLAMLQTIMDFFDPFSEKKQTALLPSQFRIETCQLQSQLFVRCFGPELTSKLLPTGTKQIEKRRFRHGLLFS